MEGTLHFPKKGTVSSEAVDRALKMLTAEFARS